jgi:hypothetical protein
VADRARSRSPMTTRADSWTTTRLGTPCSAADAGRWTTWWSSPRTSPSTTRSPRV